jgi:8-amino-7-oxononanoate synthase
MTHDPLAWIDEELQTLDSLGLLRRLRQRTSSQRAEVVVGDKHLINFGSNDYLGLAADPRIARAARDSLEHHGWGSGASPLILGRSQSHAALEQTLAAFEGTEAALVFPSGFAANVGAIAALASRGDVIFSDAKNHASIVDGCRLSGARVQIYPHGDLAYLESMMRQASRFRRRLIVTDTLFSMDGDFAPLADLCQLAEQHDCMLMVDEAHATGVFGAQGRGICELLGIEELVQIRVGTMSKALGCAGGFVAGSQSLIDWLANRARTYVFSTAPPAAWCAAATRAIEIAQQEPERRTKLLQKSAEVRTRLREQGWQIGPTESQIIPAFVGEPDLTMRLANLLHDRHLFVPGIRPPSVPEGESLLRISVSSSHTTEHLDRLCEAFAELRHFARMGK